MLAKSLTPRITSTRTGGGRVGGRRARTSRSQVAVDDLRVLRLRTFSKGYGLAGARVGYAMGAAEIIANFDKVRNHFGLCRASQVDARACCMDAARKLPAAEPFAALHR